MRSAIVLRMPPFATKRSLVNSQRDREPSDLVAGEDNLGV
jgi:hypothetical protein